MMGDLEIRYYPVEEGESRIMWSEDDHAVVETVLVAGAYEVRCWIEIGSKKTVNGNGRVNNEGIHVCPAGS